MQATTALPTVSLKLLAHLVLVDINAGNSQSPTFRNSSLSYTLLESHSMMKASLLLLVLL